MRTVERNGRASPAARDANGERPLWLDVALLCRCPEAPPLLEHLEATLAVGIGVRLARDLAEVGTADVVWVERALEGEEAHALRAAARRGALVVARESSLLEEADPPAGESTETPPSRGEEVDSLRRVLSELLGTALDLRDAKPSLLPLAALSSVKPDVEILCAADAGAYAALRPLGAGAVLWLGLLPPAEGMGCRVQSQIPVRAALTQVVVDEVLVYAFARRHGCSVRKAFGPYGTPMMAWQSHVEEFEGLVNESMTRFLARVRRNDQVPTFALIRRPIEWGHRVPGLLHFPRAGGSEARYVGQPDGPALFSGRWLTRDDGRQLGWATDKRYVEHYVFLEDQPRVYPAPLDGGRLAVGTPKGTIEIFSGTTARGVLELHAEGELRQANGAVIRVRGDAAPTFGDLDGDGRQGLVVADGEGTLHVFRDRGRGLVRQETIPLGGGSRVAPRLVDWYGSGRLDLVVGHADGRVEVFRDFAGRRLERRELLLETGSRHVAPFPFVVDRERRLLLGDLEGHIRTWSGGSIAPVATVDTSLTAANEPYAGQHSVPVLWQVDGRELLVAGASVVGRPYDATPRSLRRYDKLVKTLALLRRSHVPVLPHIFLFPAMKPDAIAGEIARHQQAFADVGLPWLGLGANHHCWILPTSDAQAAFRAEEASGLRFDFGWRPPTVDAAPSSDPEFALVHPFRPRDGAAAMQFVLYQPSPSPVSRERDAERMAALGLPMTFYIHSEHRMVRGTLGARELDQLIAAIERLRQKRCAIFLTEVQMARSLIGTLAAEIRVFADEEGNLRLTLDPASVPEWAAGFAGAVAVRIRRPGEHATDATTDAPCFRDDSDELVTAVGASTRVRFGNPERPRWWIERANVPLRVLDDGFEVLEPGFQQIWLRGDGLQIGWRGGLVRRVARGYVLTRWGDAGSASISPPRARPSPPVVWHSGRHGLDRWVLREAFPGRTTPGFFVDVGAADGVSSSATCTLERHFGWKGIVVEPNELLFARLRANRSAIAENACVSDRDGEVDFIEASWFGRIREHALPSIGKGDHTSDEYLRHDLDGRPSRVVKKRSLSLGSLLAKHGAPRRIDFLSIDAEGGEWSIVKALPLERYEILALCVDTKFEWEGRLHDTPDAERIRDFLIRHGYWHDAERSRTAQRDFFLHPTLHPR